MSGPEQLLTQLRDIHLPLPVEATPVAAPIASGIVLVLAVICAWAIMYRRRRLRTALRSLRQLAQCHARDGDTVRLAAGLAALLREQAVRCFPTTPVASLVDDEWLSFLAAHGGGSGFRDGPGALLASLPYRPVAGDAVDAQALLALAERWLRANPG